MWSKGAVVIVKHGDTDIANAIRSGMEIIPNRRGTAPMPRLTKAQLEEAIERAEVKYGCNDILPKAIEALRYVFFGFVVWTTKLGEVTCKCLIRIGQTCAKSMERMKTAIETRRSERWSRTASRRRR